MKFNKKEAFAVADKGDLMHTTKMLYAALDRIRELEDALKSIFDYQPLETLPCIIEKCYAEEEKCPECQRVKNAKWPPSGKCNDHYCLWSKLVWTPRERAENNQHWNMKQIAARLI